jgi:hypothetical protein
MAQQTGVGGTTHASATVSSALPVEPATQPNLIDISGLPASAAGLLKQLLASMADKEGTKEEKQIMVGAKLNEKMVQFCLRR